MVGKGRNGRTKKGREGGMDGRNGGIKERKEDKIRKKGGK